MRLMGLDWVQGPLKMTALRELRGETLPEQPDDEEWDAFPIQNFRIDRLVGGAEDREERVSGVTDEQ